VRDEACEVLQAFKVREGMGVCKWTAIAHLSWLLRLSRILGMPKLRRRGGLITEVGESGELGASWTYSLLAASAAARSAWHVTVSMQHPHQSLKTHQSRYDDGPMSLVQSASTSLNNEKGSRCLVVDAHLRQSHQTIRL
jgi:hypothetical protein